MRKNRRWVRYPVGRWYKSCSLYRISPAQACSRFSWFVVLLLYHRPVKKKVCVMDRSGVTVTGNYRPRCATSIPAVQHPAEGLKFKGCSSTCWQQELAIAARRGLMQFIHSTRLPAHKQHESPVASWFIGSSLDSLGHPVPSHRVQGRILLDLNNRQQGSETNSISSQAIRFQILRKYLTGPEQVRRNRLLRENLYKTLLPASLLAQLRRFSCPLCQMLKQAGLLP
jgi:hypothetical protein